MSEQAKSTIGYVRNSWGLLLKDRHCV